MTGEYANQKTATSKEDIYSVLKKEILDFKLKPGEMLSETEIAARFGLSRTPVREAFRKMQNEDLLEIIPKVGTRISKIKMPKIFDILYIREAVENQIFTTLSRGMEEHNIQKITALLAKQKILLDHKERTLEGAREFLKLDDQYHKEIFDMVGKAGVWNVIMESQFDYERLRMFLIIYHSPHMRENYDSHFCMVKYLFSGDLERLVECNKEHIYSGVRYAFDIIEDYSGFFSLGH